MYLMETEWEGVDWMRVAEDRERWRTIVNTEMNLLLP